MFSFGPLAAALFYLVLVVRDAGQVCSAYLSGWHELPQELRLGYALGLSLAFYVVLHVVDWLHTRWARRGMDGGSPRPHQS